MSVHLLWMIFSFCALGLGACSAQEQSERNRLPEGPGLAAKYPGDRGIEKDPNVVFAENFEAASLDEMVKRWEQAQNREIMSFSDDVPPGSGGKRSLLMTHVGGTNSGGHLYRRLPAGYDRLFVRFYVKFDPQCGP